MLIRTSGYTGDRVRLPNAPPQIMTIDKLLKTRLIKSTVELIRSRQASVLKKFIAAAADANKQEYYLKILLDLA